MPDTKKTFGLHALALHILAMALMLCDHLWATVVPGHDWLTWLGRLAFPVFAFCIAEGFAHTKSFKKYLLRLLIFALLSEIPFNLMYTGLWIFPFQQNVLWTFLLALLCMRLLDLLREKLKLWLAVPLGAIVLVVFYFAGTLTMVDYGGEGVLMAVVFYLFRGRKWYCLLGQLVCLAYINFEMISGLTVPVSLFGLSFNLPQQGMAVLSLLPIWLYNGNRGPHGKAIRCGCYAFYPVHMLLLGLIMTLR